MYTFTFGSKTHEIEELPALRKAVYSHMAHEGQRIHIQKDGRDYTYSELGKLTEKLNG